MPPQANQQFRNHPVRGQLMPADDDDMSSSSSDDDDEDAAVHDGGDPGSYSDATSSSYQSQADNSHGGYQV